MEQVLLWLAIVAPFIGFVLILAGVHPRWTAIAVTFVAFTSGAVLYATTGGGIEIIADAWKVKWLELPLVGRVDFGFNIDGVSMPLLLLSVAVSFAAVLVSSNVKDRNAEFYSLILLISGGASAAFTSIDLIGMYVFHELALIPTFLLISRFGYGAGRASVATRMAVFLMLGSLLALVGIVGLLQMMPEQVRTSNLQEMRQFFSSTPPEDGVPKWVFSVLIVGFGVLFGLFPFHSWAPAAYAASPAAVAMLHAGVLKNFGIFVLLVGPFTMFPIFGNDEFVRFMVPILGALAACNMLLLGLAALRQDRLDVTIGYISLMHMGYLVLGLLADDVFTLSSVVMLMFSHGLATAALFAWISYLRPTSSTLWINDLTGAGCKSPELMFAFGLAMMASIGLPGLAPFAGEILLFLNAFEKRTLLTLTAMVGLIVSAVILLRIYRKVFQLKGLATHDQKVYSFGLCERFTAILLGGLLIMFGLFPKWLSEPAFETILALKEQTADIKVVRLGYGTE